MRGLRVTLAIQMSTSIKLSYQLLCFHNLYYLFNKHFCFCSFSFVCECVSLAVNYRVFRSCVSTYLFIYLFIQLLIYF